MSRTMEPRRIASYMLLEQIGYGGMAVVYRARQETLDRTVAVKILSENMAASSEFMERFRREARTAANLRHPNVITVHDFGEDERGVPYLVMEFIEGPTLADLMDAGLDDERIPDLLDQIAAGLDYAHARGVIHRDIKPGNVLMTEEGRAVLADFGLAWLLEGAQLTLTGGVIGTPEYMSPEQAAGHPFDHRADVYALGIVLYEMLVGERPFISETPIGMLLQHLQDTAPSVLVARPDLPAAVGDVLAKALVKDPADRYSSAGELARAFRAAFSQRAPARHRQHPDRTSSGRRGTGRRGAGCYRRHRLCWVRREAARRGWHLSRVQVHRPARPVPQGAFRAQARAARTGRQPVAAGHSVDSRRASQHAPAVRRRRCAVPQSTAGSQPVSASPSSLSKAARSAARSSRARSSRSSASFRGQGT